MFNNLDEAMEQFRLIAGKFYHQYEFESEDECLEFFKDDVNDLISLYYNTMVFVYNNPDAQDCIGDLKNILGIIEFVGDRIKNEMSWRSVQDFQEHANEVADNAFKENMERLNQVKTDVGFGGSLFFGINALWFAFENIVRYSPWLSFEEALLLFGKMVNIVSEMADNFEAWFWETEPKSSFEDGVVLEYGKTCVSDSNWNYLHYDWDFSYNNSKHLPVIVLEDEPVIIDTCVVEPGSQKALNPAQLLLTASFEFVDLNEDVSISIIPVVVDLLPVEACTELLLGVTVNREVIGDYVPIA